MKQIAEGVWQFRFLLANAINAFYIEGDGAGIVVDASTWWDWGPIRKQLEGRPVTGVVLTHAHPDHQGCAAKICEKWNVPLMVHEADVESAEGRAPLVRQNFVWEAIGNVIWAGRRSKVGRVLHEGDMIAGFKVYHMPGHTRGASVLFREQVGVAVVGDVVNLNHPLTQCTPHLRQPPWWFSEDPAENRRSIKKLWALRPKVVCAGHGAVWRDMERFERFVQRLR